MASEPEKEEKLVYRGWNAGMGMGISAGLYAGFIPFPHASVLGYSQGVARPSLGRMAGFRARVSYFPMTTTVFEHYYYAEYPTDGKFLPTSGQTTSVSFTAEWVNRIGRPGNFWRRSHLMIPVFVDMSPAFYDEKFRLSSYVGSGVGVGRARVNRAKNRYALVDLSLRGGIQVGRLALPKYYVHALFGAFVMLTVEVGKIRKAS